MNKQCIILAAGRNSRLDTGQPKSLIEINGVSLLERHIILFKRVGCTEFCVVTGHNPDPIRKRLEELKKSHGVHIDTVHNERFDLENGFSVGVTEQWLSDRNSERFFLTMGDHVFDETFISKFHDAIESRDISEKLCLAVDVPSPRNAHIDLEDVTRVLVNEHGYIDQIGKMIKNYNRFDAGLFFMKKAIFKTLKECFQNQEYTISDMVSRLIQKREAITVDVIGSLWNDVDNPSDLEKSIALGL